MPRPHLVLAHPALGSAEQFIELRKPLERRFTVHTFDFEGHGSTPARERPLRTEHLLENLFDYLNEAGIESAFLFGHSLGGYIGLRACLAAPQRIAAVHTFGTELSWDQAKADAMLAELDADKIEEKVPKFAAMLAARHTAIEWRVLVARTAEYIARMGQHPEFIIEDMARIQQPVRLGVGDRDHMVSVEETALAARSAPKGELMVLGATPHALERLRAVPLVASLEDFFLND